LPVSVVARFSVHAVIGAEVPRTVVSTAALPPLQRRVDASSVEALRPLSSPGGSEWSPRADALMASGLALDRLPG
jgi:hypothetical protein